MGACKSVLINVELYLHITMEVNPTQIVSQHCQAWDIIVDEGGMVLRDCEHITTRGPYCFDHASQLLGLRVGQSTIRGAGLGLYATRDIAKYTVIDQYRGEILTKQQYEQRPSDYAIGISNGWMDDEDGMEIDGEPVRRVVPRVIDSIRSTDCYARFANQGTRRTTNAWLMSERKFGRERARPRFQNGSGSVVFLVSKKVIPAGSEILTDYGHGYWRDRVKGLEP